MEGRADEDESLPRQFTTTDTFYASETSTRLAEEATGYYRKPWQEIYEMLRAKLKIYNTAPGLSCSDQSHEHHRQGAGKDQKCPNLKHLSGEKQDKNEKMD